PSRVGAARQAGSPHREGGELGGQVTAVTASSLTIAPEEGPPVTLGTKASTVVILDGAPSTLAAIVVGDKARALYDRTTLVAAAIEAESPHHELAEIEGKVTAVTASSLTITPEEGAPVTLGTDASTVVILDGAPSKLSAIVVGDKARALYDATTLIAAGIQAQSAQHRLAGVEGGGWRSDRRRPAAAAASGAEPPRREKCFGAPRSVRPEPAEGPSGQQAIDEAVEDRAQGRTPIALVPDRVLQQCQRVAGE